MNEKDSSLIGLVSAGAAGALGTGTSDPVRNSEFPEGYRSRRPGAKIRNFGDCGRIGYPDAPQIGVVAPSSRAEPARCAFGEVAERLKAAVLKTVGEQSPGGSNPSLSANPFRMRLFQKYNFSG